jgi:2-dehydropantoate 2-reductase
MKTLIIGAGVIGSFNAAKLKEGGANVTLLARGQRLAELREHGVVLENSRRGRLTVHVPLTDHLAPDDAYDLAIVVVRRNQIASVLPMLAANRRIPSVLFLGNNAAGPEEMVRSLGPQRVLIGVVNMGGFREDHVVHYLLPGVFPLRFSELDDRRTPRTDAIVGFFRSAGVRAHRGRHIDEQLRTHAAGLPAIAGAVYKAGGDIRALAHCPELVRLFVQAQREALRALRAAGVHLRPAATRMFEWLPDKVLVYSWSRFFDTQLAVEGGQRHVNAAPDEMKELADEFRTLFRRTAVPCPASELLFAEVDARFRSWSVTREPSGHVVGQVPEVHAPM